MHDNAKLHGLLGVVRFLVVDSPKRHLSHTSDEFLDEYYASVRFVRTDRHFPIGNYFEQAVSIQAQLSPFFQCENSLASLFA